LKTFKKTPSISPLVVLIEGQSGNISVPGKLQVTSKKLAPPNVGRVVQWNSVIRLRVFLVIGIERIFDIFKPCDAFLLAILVLRFSSQAPASQTIPGIEIGSMAKSCTEASGSVLSHKLPSGIPAFSATFRVRSLAGSVQIVGTVMTYEMVCPRKKAGPN